MMTKLRNNFLTGILVLIPIVVAIWLIRLAIGMVEGIYHQIPISLDENTHFLVKGLLGLGVTVGVIALIAFFGLLSKNYIGQWILRRVRSIFARLPIVGTVYSALEELLNFLGNGSQGQFSRVVYVEFPRRGAWAVGFVTGPAQGRAVEPGYINVFIPTVPNPTSGFHFIVPENEVRDSKMNVEEAFRTILSFGMAKIDQKSDGQKK